MLVNNTLNSMKDGECEIPAGVVFMDLIQHFTRVCEHTRIY